VADRCIGCEELLLEVVDGLVEVALELDVGLTLRHLQLRHLVLLRLQRLHKLHVDARQSNG
jgi:hypothetical protein